MLQLIADCLPDVQNLLFAAGIDEKGFEFNAQTIFRPGEHPAARKLLDLLRSGDEPSSLGGLPKGRLIAVQAVRSDGSQNRALIRALLDHTLRFWIDEKRLISLAERPTFVGLFDEVWQRLRGSQFAVYRNDDPARGLFSMVAILHAADPEEFLKEMRQLARFASPGELKLDGDNVQADDVATVRKLIKELGDPDFRVRQSASLKLSLIGSPALPYLEKAVKSEDREVAIRARRLRQRIQNSIEARQRDVLSKSLLSNLTVRWGDFPKAETRKGLPIDILKMDLEGKSQMAKSNLREAFGPEWSKIRIAVKGKKIVVLLGSNTDLLDETLVNLSKPKPGTPEHKQLAEFHRRSSPSRRAEFHINLRQFAPWVNGTGKSQATSELTSLSLGVEQDSLELHLWVPNQEFRALNRLP